MHLSIGALPRYLKGEISLIASHVPPLLVESDLHLSGATNHAETQHYGALRFHAWCEGYTMSLSMKPLLLYLVSL